MPAFACLLLAGCVAPPPPSPPLALAEILKDPARYNGARVHVCGFLDDGHESCALWERQAIPVPGMPGVVRLPKDWAWVSTEDGSCAPGNPQPGGGEPAISMWVVVSGTFQTGKPIYGMGARHQLVATRIAPAAYMCGAEIR